MDFGMVEIVIFEKVMRKTVECIWEMGHSALPITSCSTFNLVW